MPRTESIMGMPITIEIIGDVSPDLSSQQAERRSVGSDQKIPRPALSKKERGWNDSNWNLAYNEAFDYFRTVDQTFSTYKEASEIMKLNRGELELEETSADMQEIFRLANETKAQTNGFFDIGEIGKCDPSGIVKGWAIQKVAEQLQKNDIHNFYINAGGDIAAVGQNAEKKPWRVGIRNPFNKDEIVKVVQFHDQGMAPHQSMQGFATSGTYERGQHIINPKTGQAITEIVSLSVIGQNIYEADRFATAAFAMGKEGIQFIEKIAGLEGYIIDKNGIATETSGFGRYVAQ